MTARERATVAPGTDHPGNPVGRTEPRERTPWLLAFLCLLIGFLPSYSVPPEPLKSNGSPATLIAITLFGLCLLGFAVIRRTSSTQTVRPGLVRLRGTPNSILPWCGVSLKHLRLTGRENQMVYVAEALDLRAGDRARLDSLVRSSSVRAGLATRARIVLLAADGVSNTEIAQRTGTTRPTVLKWRGRYSELGIDGLADEPRPGRAPVIDEVAVLAETLADKGKPPDHLGASNWSTRLMADRLGISFASVARIWRKWNIQPHRVETFKFSTDPELEARLRDVVGLYLDPPAGAVVVSVDEKSQIQALDRTQPILRLRQGIPEQQTHDYIRHGTTSLFAALEIATGKVTADACYPRHTNVEFLDFLKLVAKAHPRVKPHVICDNYATHKHDNIGRWLAKNPRVTLHFTPTSCSWLNMVEIFFGIITRQAIRRGTFTGVADLETAIRNYIDAYNDRAKPFLWTKTADELLGKIKRKSINNTQH